MREFEIEIDGKAYKGVTASAKNQFEALHIAGRTGLVALLRNDPQDMSLVALILQIPFDDVNRLINLLVKDCVTTSDAIPVAENLFRDDIQNYYLLLAYTIKENLGNFWKLRHQTDAKAAEQTP